MAHVQSAFGKLGPYLIDFFSEEDPVASTIQSPKILAPGWKLIGESNNADDGIVLSDTFLNGVGRLTTTDEDTEGVAIAANLGMTAANNGTLVLEARVSLPAQTARSVFIGFGGVAGDVLTEVVTGATATLTYVATTGDNVVGFVFDSQLTSKNWHLVNKGGTASSPTTTTTADSGVLPVNGEFDVLRLLVHPDGTAEWYINGVLERRTVAALSPTTIVAPIVGVFATTTTVATMDVDYAAWEANRWWDRDSA